MCGLSASILAQGVDYLIQATGGASTLTVNQRGFAFLALFYLAIFLISNLSRFKPSTAFGTILSIVATLLLASSVWTAEFPKILATAAGIRIKGTSELIISKETCAHVQMVAMMQALKNRADWKSNECAESGVLLLADVQVHSGGRWLLQPRAMDGVEMPIYMGRITASEAAVELILPAQRIEASEGLR